MYTVPESTVEKEDNTESNESNPSSQTVNVSQTFFGIWKNGTKSGYFFGPSLCVTQCRHPILGLVFE